MSEEHCSDPQVQVEVLKHEETTAICEPEEGEIVEVAIIEELVKTTKRIPLAKLYRLRVNRDNFDTAKAVLTGQEILALAGLSPETAKLYQHLGGKAPSPVKPDQEVDLRAHGVERFTTISRDTTEGDGALQRMFTLPATDTEYLDRHGFEWEAIRENNGMQWLIIHGWRLPAGYNYASVKVALHIVPSYPEGQLDMMYVHPHLARTDKKPIGALTDHPIRGINWQRWSRHRTGQNPWRPEIDNVSTQLTLVDEWFRREFEGA